MEESTTSYPQTTNEGPNDASNSTSAVENTVNQPRSQQDTSNNQGQIQPFNNVNNNINNNVQQQLNNQFGTIRDRIFQAMLVRMAVCYSQYIPKLFRRLIEFITLLIALFLLFIMLYVHFSFGRRDADCLSSLSEVWPRDGVLRVEVINNWDKYNAFQERFVGIRTEKSSPNTTFFNLKEILIKGPNSIPKELRRRSQQLHKKSIDHWSNLLFTNQTIFDFLWRFGKTRKDYFTKDNLLQDPQDTSDEQLEQDDTGPEATYECVIEYSLHNGLLRLSDGYRMEHNIPFMRVRIDPDTDACFGDAFDRFLMRHFLGFEDMLMSSVKSLAGNEIEKGFLKDLVSGELYRFVPSEHSRLSYLYAFFVMLIFTFAISMLLRFSHYQIFIFIVDLLQIFDQNSIMAFPAAPLLTVIMALFGR
uniref:SSD domain-containing protein n=1 Tax=Syphacia muris TaxID=451379 RepID=A0A0N5AQT3_9BILA